MSEPMSNRDIEDVLSSIRRLVSDDLRPAHRASPQDVAPEPEKLILTPSLRVVSSPTRRAPADTPRMLQLVEMPDAFHFIPWEPKAGDFSSDGPDDDEIEDEGWDEGEAPPPPVRATFGSIRGGGVPASVLAAAATPPAATPVQASLEQVVASVSAAVESQMQDWEPEEGAPDAPQAGFGPTPWINGRRPAPEPEEDLAPGLKADLGDIAGLAAPADDGEMRDAAAARRREELLELLDEDSLQIEEDLLRDLVRDVVREEMEGGLDGMIARSVRKMVRAELARLLVSGKAR